MGLMLVLTFAMLFLLIPGTVIAKEKIAIGLVEDVILLPWGVKLPARIDTGAATSSLDARDLKVQDGMAEFKLPEKRDSTSSKVYQLHFSFGSRYGLAIIGRTYNPRPEGFIGNPSRFFR